MHQLFDRDMLLRSQKHFEHFETIIKMIDAFLSEELSKLLSFLGMDLFHRIL